MRADLTSSIEHGLVDGVAVGVELGDEDVQRDALDRNGDEHPALVLGQLLVPATRTASSSARDSATASGLSPARPGTCSQPVSSSRTPSRRQTCRPNLVDTSRITKAHAHVVKRLSPRKSPTRRRIGPRRRRPPGPPDRRVRVRGCRATRFAAPPPPARPGPAARAAGRPPAPARPRCPTDHQPRTGTPRPTHPQRGVVRRGVSRRAQRWPRCEATDPRRHRPAARHPGPGPGRPPGHRPR